MDSFLELANSEYFILIFVFFWLFISWLISSISGWAMLADSYPGTVSQESKKFWFQSIAMRIMTNYGGVIQIKVGDDKIGFSVLFPFRFGHAPIAMPWEDLSTSSGSQFLFNYIQLNFDKEPEVPIRISHKLAKKIQNASHGKFNYTA